MSKSPQHIRPRSEWFAIRTSDDLAAVSALASYFPGAIVPKVEIRNPGERKRIRFVSPGLVIVRAERASLLQLESGEGEGQRELPEFTICRYPGTDYPVILTPRQVALLRQLETAPDSPGHCQIFNKADFPRIYPVRVVGGPFQGYAGYIQRVQKNKHVIVPIANLCNIMLPFIPPTQLEEKEVLVTD